MRKSMNAGSFAPSIGGGRGEAILGEAL